jgi:hypothetical protein
MMVQQGAQTGAPDSGARPVRLRPVQIAYGPSGNAFSGPPLGQAWKRRNRHNENGHHHGPAGLLHGLVGSAPASTQGISVGPGGVRIVDGRRDRRGYEERRFERRGERCRVEVERRRNRFGEVVTRRTRVCR